MVFSVAQQEGKKDSGLFMSAVVLLLTWKNSGLHLGFFDCVSHQCSVFLAFYHYNGKWSKRAQILSAEVECKTFPLSVKKAHLPLVFI